MEEKSRAGAAGGVHHVAIKARDVVRVATFYREVLGFAEVARHLDGEGSLRSIWLLLPGGPILMIERAYGIDAPAAEGGFFAERPGLHLLAFTIAAGSGAEVRRRLSDHGVAVEHHTDYTLYVLDPEGNRVGLSSYPERA